MNPPNFQAPPTSEHQWSDHYLPALATELLEILFVRVMALAVLLVGCGQAGWSAPSSFLSADSVAFDSTDVGSTSVEIVDRSAGLLLEASRNTAFEAWGSQDPVAVMESERFDSLVDIKRRSSAVVAARIGAELEPHVVEGDAGTGDVVSFARYGLTVVEALAGTRTVEPGQELVLEFAIGFPPQAHEQVVILFLRFMRDGSDGRPNPEWVSLPETWRLVNSQGVFVDSGDGRPVNPIAVVRAWEVRVAWWRWRSLWCRGMTRRYRRIRWNGRPPR